MNNHFMGILTCKGCPTYQQQNMEQGISGRGLNIPVVMVAKLLTIDLKIMNKYFALSYST